VREYIQYMGSCRKITTGTPVDVLKVKFEVLSYSKLIENLSTSFLGFLGKTSQKGYKKNVSRNLYRFLEIDIRP